MTQTAINYGKILYDLNIPREQIQILDELLSEEPKIVAYLSNPTIEQPEKSAVVNRILDGELAAFVNMLCKYHRTKYLPDAIQAYYKHYDKQKGIVRCTLKYAKAVTQEEKEKMQHYIEWTYDEFCVSFLNESLNKLEQIDIFQSTSFEDFYKNFWNFNLVVVRSIIIDKCKELGYDYKKFENDGNKNFLKNIHLNN